MNPKIQLEPKKTSLLILLISLMFLWSVIIYLFGPEGSKEERRIVLNLAALLGKLQQLKRAKLINSTLGLDRSASRGH